jgi:hypothetical protein
MQGERIGFWTAAIRQWWTSILSMCIVYTTRRQQQQL